MGCIHTKPVKPKENHEAPEPTQPPVDNHSSPRTPLEWTEHAGLTTFTPPAQRSRRLTSSRHVTFIQSPHEASLSSDDYNEVSSRYDEINDIMKIFEEETDLEHRKQMVVLIGFEELFNEHAIDDKNFMSHFKNKLMHLYLNDLHNVSQKLHHFHPTEQLTL